MLTPKRVNTIKKTMVSVPVQNTGAPASNNKPGAKSSPEPNKKMYDSYKSAKPMSVEKAKESAKQIASKFKRG